MEAFSRELRRLAAIDPPPASAATLWNRSALVPWERRRSAGLAPLIEALERQDVWLSTDLGRRAFSAPAHRAALVALDVWWCYGRAAPFPVNLNADAEVAAIMDALQHEMVATAATPLGLAPALAARVARVERGACSRESIYLLQSGAVAMTFK